jgi:hypothetical protein
MVDTGRRHDDQQRCGGGGTALVAAAASGELPTAGSASSRGTIADR